MKGIKLVFLLLFPILVMGQRSLKDSVHIKSSIFHIVYSEKLQQPLIVEYKSSCPGGTFSRAGMDFYTNDSVITSDNLDYANNIYDKGHMAPAADFSCSKETLYATFSYLNCALQDQYLNRGTWRLLEEYERTLIRQYGLINVKIIVEFKQPLTILKTGATVPSGFYKHITIVKTNKTLKFYFPNHKPTSSNIFSYEIK